MLTFWASWWDGNATPSHPSCRNQHLELLDCQVLICRYFLLGAGGSPGDIALVVSRVII